MLSKEQYDNYLKREEMREEYMKNRITSVSKIVSSQENWSKENPLDKPRHRTDCDWFKECSFCYKCENYDPKYERCRQCVLNNTDGICKKPHIHTESAKAKLIKRPVIRKKGKINNE